LLKRAIKDWKREYALSKLKNGEWTIGKAARFLEISFTEMVRGIEENKLKLGERKLI
jgi:predicted HTH domain antitoxin